MILKNNNFLVNERVGIIGAGILGRTLAEAFITHGIPKERLLVSYGGKSSTFENIKKAGLIENISDNKVICQQSTIIFIAIKPQSLKELKNLPFKTNSLVISCMAGISLASLEEALGVNVFRIMTSAPDTIKRKKGIVAVYPRNDTLTNILSLLSLKVYELQDEESMHVFTVGVCLPAALLIANKKGLNVEDSIEIFRMEYCDFKEIYNWAKSVLPTSLSEEDQTKYIEHMSTKGGITEAIVNSLNSGDTFLDSLRTGIARSKEISSFIGFTFA